MTGPQCQEDQEPQAEFRECIPLLPWLTWMAAGNAALFLCAALVAQGTAPPVIDSIFFIVVIGLMVVRCADITRFKGQTSESKPGTLADWRR